MASRCEPACFTLPSRRAHCPYRGPDAHVSWYQLDSGVQSTEDTSLDAGKRTEYISTEDKLKIRGRDALLVCPWFRLLTHFWHEQGRHSDTRCNNSQASTATATSRSRTSKPLLHGRSTWHGSCPLSSSPVLKTL